MNPRSSYLATAALVRKLRQNLLASTSSVLSEMIIERLRELVTTVLCYGGGLNSWAMLLGSEERGELPDVVAFVDVADGTVDRDGQDPGEWPSTYRHIREVVIPWCRARGVEFVWISKLDYSCRGHRSYFDWMRHPEKTAKPGRKVRGIQIPVASKRFRRCTIWAKIEPFNAWAADRFGDAPIEKWIGFEDGEQDRAKNDPNAGSESATRINRYPLIEWGWCRCRCERAARQSGLPVPRKSACVFCPLASRADWLTLAAELPEQFAKIVELEEVKPRTSNGVKMTIMAFNAPRKDGTRKLNMLPTYVSSAFKARGSKVLPCDVCGAPERATKHTGCGYLGADEFVADELPLAAE